MNVVITDKFVSTGNCFISLYVKRDGTWNNDPMARSSTHSDAMEDFIHRFDDGDYPNLVKSEN